MMHVKFCTKIDHYIGLFGNSLLEEYYININSYKHGQV